MKSILQSVAAGCVFVLSAWISAGTCQAQQFVRPYYNPYNRPTTNPYTSYESRVSMQANRGANATSAAVMSTNYSGYPGYSGYPSYSGYHPTPYNYATPYATPYNNPYMSQMPGYGGGYGSPYAPPVGGAGYGGMPYPSYSTDPYGVGSTLKGAADLNNSTGNVTIAYQKARILREQANQAKIDTTKKQLDFDMYLASVTPSYTEQQEKVAKLTLRRIQKNATPGEIANGKALNFLLKDLAKYPNKKTAVEPIQLSEAALAMLNVTQKSHGMGILRDEGKFTWPAALQDIVSAKDRKDLDANIRSLVANAQKGKQLDVNLLKDVRTKMEEIRTDLVNRVNDVPTAQYIDSKRFLQDFQDATIALERGQAKVQMNFQRFIEGGKSVQDLAEYMNTNGLTFAPATAADESGYRVVHAAMAAYDIDLNAQLNLTSASAKD